MPDQMLRTWARLDNFAINLATGTNTVVDLLGDFRTEQGTARVRATVSAIYGECNMVPQALVAGGVVTRHAIAIGVMDIGVTAATAPDPTSESFPWLWIWETHLAPNRREMAATDFRTVPEYRHIAVRSQRTIRFNQSLFAVFSNLAGASCQMSISGRALLKT